LIELGVIPDAFAVLTREELDVVVLDVVQEDGGLICTEFAVQLAIAQINFLYHLILIRIARILLILLFSLLSRILFPDVL
jgi:hypothetical protein